MVTLRRVKGKQQQVHSCSTYRLLVPGLLLLDGFVDDEIHEGVIAAQDPRQLPATVDLECQPKMVRKKEMDRGLVTRILIAF